MNKLLHRKKRDPAGEKDVEAHGSNSGSPSAGAAPPLLDPNINLGEYPALDRYISLYQVDGALGASSDDDNAKGRRKTKRWWQFWKSSAKATSVQPAGAGADLHPEWTDTDIRTGISDTDVEERRQRVGWNELTTEKVNPFYQFVTYFMGPILYVMEVAALLAVGLGDWIDFGVILGILFLNAFVGFYQEMQAADVVASLKGDIAMRCMVVRGGVERNILARELVPGDIVSAWQRIKKHEK